MYWVEVLKRITSSTASAMSDGSVMSAARWSGWSDSSSTALATILAVVSKPANENRRQNPSSSLSVRARPSTSSSSRSEMSPPPGTAPARRRARSSVK